LTDVTVCAIRHRSFSSAVAASTALRNLASNALRAVESDDRMSTSIHASEGIELIDVPPPTRPTLKVVLGLEGTWNSPTFAMARPIAPMGLGSPNAEKL
jgi:hypothetical protein